MVGEGGVGRSPASHRRQSRLSPGSLPGSGPVAGRREGPPDSHEDQAQISDEARIRSEADVCSTTPWPFTGGTGSMTNVSPVTAEQGPDPIGYATPRSRSSSHALSAASPFVKFVDCKTREMVRDHIKACLPYLSSVSPHGAIDSLCTDAFVSSVRSVCGCNCFQLPCRYPKASQVLGFKGNRRLHSQLWRRSRLVPLFAIRVHSRSAASYRFSHSAASRPVVNDHDAITCCCVAFVVVMAAATRQPNTCRPKVAKSSLNHNNFEASTTLNLVTGTR